MKFLLIALFLLSCQDQEHALKQVSNHLKYSASQQAQVELNHEQDVVVKKGMARFWISEAQSDLKIHAPDITVTTQSADFQIEVYDSEIKIFVNAGLIQVSSPYVMSFVPETIKANEKIFFDRVKKEFKR